MTSTALLALTAGGLAVAGAWEALAAVEHARVVQAVGRLADPLRAVRRAGREPSAAERRRLVLVAAAALGAAGALLLGPLPGLAVGLAAPIAVRAVVQGRQARWRAEVAAAAAPAARAMADALAGGHALRAAVAVAARDGAVPRGARSVLGEAADALALGAPADEVLEDVRRRAAAPAWDAVVAAALLQRDAGGDLAGLLRAIAARLEEADRLEADARTATAQARLTARLVLALPLGAAALAELAAPGTLTGALHEPLAVVPLAAAAVLQLAAVLAIRRLGRPLP